MKIYTRVGDQGMTKQISGKMVAKTDAQIVTLGDIDELQSYLGVVVASLQPTQTAIAEELSDIQRKLYELQADISVKRHQTMVPADTEWLEGKIDEYMAATPELKEFILPGGSAWCTLTVCPDSGTAGRTFGSDAQHGTDIGTSHHDVPQSLIRLLVCSSTLRQSPRPLSRSA